MSDLVPYLLVLIVAALVIYFIVRIRKTVEVDDSAAMTPNSRRILIGYLLFNTFRNAEQKQFWAGM